MVCNIEVAKAATHCVKSHHMEDIMGILLYNCFIELPVSNQTFEEKQGYFKLLRVRQTGRKEHATLCVASEDFRKCKEKSEENSVTVSNRTTRKTFLPVLL